MIKKTNNKISLTESPKEQYSCSIGSLDIERFTREVDKFLHALGEAEPVE